MNNFRAEGGFSVSGRRTNSGEIDNVTIHSALGNKCHVANPWQDNAVKVTDSTGNTIEISVQKSRHICFDTEPKTTYYLYNLSGPSGRAGSGR